MIDENAGLAIIKGAGDKAFCAGGDALCKYNCYCRLIIIQRF
jgi:1,4-dihydroxy-2-naphthoyl-CoA synthase